MAEHEQVDNAQGPGDERSSGLPSSGLRSPSTPGFRSSSQPPRWAVRLLERACPPRDREEVQGDLLELYQYWIERYGVPGARRRYVGNVLGLLPAFSRKRRFSFYPKPLYPDMIRNYLIVACRNLLQNKAYSGLNIIGLAFGLVSSLLIMLWVQDEWNYDRFHAHADKLYRVTVRIGDQEAAITSLRMASALPAELPAVRAATRVKEAQELVRVGNRKFEEKRVMYVDPSFLDVFSFPLVQGAPRTALRRPDAVVITQAVALRYFGTTDAVGKRMQVLAKETTTWNDLTVAGVLRDIPHQSHLQFDLLLPYARRYGTDDFARNDAWDSFTVFTYLQLHDRAASVTGIGQQVATQIEALHRKQKSAVDAQFAVQPLTDIHLRTSPLMLHDVEGHGNLAYVQAFFGVAVVILLIACINFMNLSTARSARRAKEVGVRKVAGARRWQLVGQFLSESFVCTLLALGVALAGAGLLLPAFNGLTGKHITLGYVNGHIGLGIAAIALLTGLLAGSYPALYLSGFQPVKALKGRMTPAGGAAGLRNGLVVLQFVASTVLIAGTLVVYGQLQYIRNRNLGFDRENLLYVPLPETGDLALNTQTLKNTLGQYPETGAFTVTSHLPVNLNTGMSNFEWEGKDHNSELLIPFLLVDDRFLSTFGIKLVAGRGFLPGSEADQTNYLVNRAALKVMKYDLATAVGRSLSIGDDMKGQIVGVTEDFNFKSVHQAVEPLVLRYHQKGGYVVVRTGPGAVPATIRRLETLFAKLYPDHPFAYHFLDEDLDRLYRAERRTGYLCNAFAGVALAISCLGLLGLAAYTAEQRTKEIGIRKVLGASAGGIVALLSRNFCGLVLVAIFIAAPIAWWATDQWLAGFAYRVNPGWWPFGAAGLVTVALALLTVSFQALRAALANPVQALRAE